MAQLNRENYLLHRSANPPQYNLEQVKIGVIHMGLSAFHRGHQALFFEKILRSGNLNFGVAGVTQRSSDVADVMNSQDCLYTINEREGAGFAPIIVGAIRKALFFPQARKELLEIARSENLKLITLTVSEKAYQCNSTRNGVNLNSAEVQADIADTNSLLTFPSRLLDLLVARFESGLAGVAVISCDNLPTNGDITRAVVVDLAIKQNRSPDFLIWLKSEIRFPNSMVDRAVPAITQDSIDEFYQSYGYEDRSLITAEPYLEWVIENDPISEYLAPVGARFVAKVAPYEAMKIRVFNGAHSALAYICQLAGIEYVAEGIVDPVIGDFIKNFQEKEAGRSFVAPADLDPIEYAKIIRKRVSNYTLLHKSIQIAMDGSQKLPQRIFASANDLLKLGLSTDHITIIMAAWLRFLEVNEKVNDPLAASLQNLVRNPDALQSVSGTLGFEGLATNVDPKLFSQIATWLAQLRIKPVREVLQTLKS
ncbi:MAG: mannitol dehydrogenase family protein [Candidatus Nanopelagicaceae bacterium]|nr:mannitol dehydrogenase family protein [Candidatus Nanopelagicaceae bacterium]